MLGKLHYFSEGANAFIRDLGKNPSVHEISVWDPTLFVLVKKPKVLKGTIYFNFITRGGQVGHWP